MPANLVTLTPADVAAFPPANYVDPVQRIWAIPVLAIFYTIGNGMFFIRIWTRLRWPDIRHSNLGWDDLLLSIGWLFQSAFSVLGIVGELHFFALRHFWDVPRSSWAPLMLLYFIGQNAFVLSVGFIRVSILLFYRRLTEIAVARTWKIVTWIAIVVVILYSVGWLVLPFIGCQPLEAFWMAYDLDWDVPYQCIDSRSSNIVAGALGAFTDLYTVVLPMAMTRKLPLSKGRKRALRVIFLFGLTTVAVSCARTYFHWRMTFDTDVSWQVYNTFTAAYMEVSLGLACASAPACWSFYRKYILQPWRRLSFRSPLYFSRRRHSSSDGSTAVATLGVAEVPETKDGVIVWDRSSGTSPHRCPTPGKHAPKLHVRIPPGGLHDANEAQDIIQPLSPVRSIDEFAMQDWEIIEASKKKLRHDSGKLEPLPACPDCGRTSTTPPSDSGGETIVASRRSDSVELLGDLRRPKS